MNIYKYLKSLFPTAPKVDIIPDSDIEVIVDKMRFDNHVKDEVNALSNGKPVRIYKIKGNEEQIANAIKQEFLKIRLDDLFDKVIIDNKEDTVDINLI